MVSRSMTSLRTDLMVCRVARLEGLGLVDGQSVGLEGFVVVLVVFSSVDMVVGI